MGTSRALPKPTGVAWDDAREARRAWLKNPGADIAPLGEACRRALAEDLSADPDKYDLPTAMLTAGERLIDILTALRQDGSRALQPPEPIEDPVEAAHAEFVNWVGGEGNLIADTAVGRAAARCADQMLAADSSLATDLISGGNGKISSDIFCEIYRLFFGEAVGEFLKTAILTKIELTVPMLPLLPFGLGNEVADWVAKQIIAVIPSPCEETKTMDDDGGTLATVGRKLLDKTIKLSLDPRHSGEAGAGEAE